MTHRDKWQRTECPSKTIHHDSSRIALFCYFQIYTYVQIACTFSKTWYKPFWFSGYKQSFNFFRYGSRTITIGKQMRKYTLNWLLSWKEEEEEEKETIKLLKKRALAGIQPGTFWSENFCVITPCATRTIETTLRTDGRTNRGSDIVLNWL